MTVRRGGTARDGADLADGGAPAWSRRRLLLTAGAGLGLAGFGLAGLPRPSRAADGTVPPSLAALPPVSAEAAALLAALPGKALVGAPAGSPVITELVDVNAPDWRRSVADMKELVAGDARLGYAIVQAPRRDLRSVEVARVALAVLQLSGDLTFGRFYELLATREGVIDGKGAIETARALGLDPYQLFKAGNQPDVTLRLGAAVDLTAALRILDTPAYVIGGRVLHGYADLAKKRALVADVRACAC